MKSPEQQRAVRLKTLGVDYTEENISRRIRDYLDSLSRIKTVGEIISEVMEEFTRQMRTFSFPRGNLPTGVDKMNEHETALTLKKQTLTAWTKILLRDGSIDFAKSGRMLALIDKLSA